MSWEDANNLFNKLKYADASKMLVQLINNSENLQPKFFLLQAKIFRKQKNTELADENYRLAISLSNGTNCNIVSKYLDYLMHCSCKLQKAKTIDMKTFF